LSWQPCNFFLSISFPESNVAQLLRKTDETNRRAEEILVRFFCGPKPVLFCESCSPLATPFFNRFRARPFLPFPAKIFILQNYKKRNEERRQQEQERKAAREREVETEITKRQIERLQREARVRHWPFCQLKNVTS
jgi:hypothetical protein